MQFFSFWPVVRCGLCRRRCPRTRLRRTNGGDLPLLRSPRAREPSVSARYSTASPKLLGYDNTLPTLSEPSVSARYGTVSPTLLRYMQHVASPCLLPQKYFNASYVLRACIQYIYMNKSSRSRRPRRRRWCLSRWAWVRQSVAEHVLRKRIPSFSLQLRSRWFSGMNVAARSRALADPLARASVRLVWSSWARNACLSCHVMSCHHVICM